jgi:hypothetical protein
VIIEKQEESFMCNYIPSEITGSIDDGLREIAFIRREYPHSIYKNDNGYFYVIDVTEDCPQIYFDTYEECAIDLALEIGVTNDERASINF